MFNTSGLDGFWLVFGGRRVWAQGFLHQCLPACALLLVPGSCCHSKMSSIGHIAFTPALSLGLGCIVVSTSQNV